MSFLNSSYLNWCSQLGVCAEGMGVRPLSMYRQYTVNMYVCGMQNEQAFIYYTKLLIIIIITDQ